MSDIVKGHVAPGYERVKEIYQQVSKCLKQNSAFISLLVTFIFI